MSSIPKSHSGETAKYFAWLWSRGIHFLKFQRRLRIAHQNEFDGAYEDFGVCDKCALIVLGATFSDVFFFFCYSQVWERFDQDEAPSPSQADQIHLRTQAATISLQESLYPLLPPMLSVFWQVPRQQPSRTPAPLWKRKTAPAELWVASNDSVARKMEKSVTGWERRTLNALHTLKNAYC